MSGDFDNLKNLVGAVGKDISNLYKMLFELQDRVSSLEETIFETAYEPVKIKSVKQKEKGTMSDYQKRKEKCLYEELKSVYPELAPPDERTSEEKKRDAEQDKIDLFGSEENKEE